MAGHRQARINEELAHELSKVLREIQDPRISGSLVSVTEVNCAKDLKTATVYYSFLQQKHTEKEVRKALIGAAGYLRTHLARTLNLRETPQLHFVYDDSVERGNRIAAILHDVTAEFPENREADGEKNED